jgi:hypothetical protein
MVFITKEEKTELVIGFIQHVFSEIQVDGWKRRRDELLFNNTGYYHDYVKKDIYENEIEDVVFDKMMEDCQGDANEFIISLFYPIISSFGWIECWCCQQRPEIYEEHCPLSEWEMLYNFIYKDNNVDDLKELLGLNISLK